VKSHESDRRVMSLTCRPGANYEPMTMIMITITA